MTRHEKIKMLQELRAGKISIDALRPPKASIRINERETEYFKDGQPIEAAVFSELLKLQPRPITFKVAEL